jgi:hypothetical protein
MSLVGPHSSFASTFLLSILSCPWPAAACDREYDKRKEIICVISQARAAVRLQEIRVSLILEIIRLIFITLL